MLIIWAEGPQRWFCLSTWLFDWGWLPDVRLTVTPHYLVKLWQAWDTNWSPQSLMMSSGFHSSWKPVQIAFHPVWIKWARLTAGWVWAIWRSHHKVTVLLSDSGRSVSKGRWAQESCDLGRVISFPAGRCLCTFGLGACWTGRHISVYFIYNIMPSGFFFNTFIGLTGTRMCCNAHIINLLWSLGGT